MPHLWHRFETLCHKVPTHLIPRRSVTKTFDKKILSKIAVFSTLSILLCIRELMGVFVLFFILSCIVLSFTYNVIFSASSCFWKSSCSLILFKTPWSRSLNISMLAMMSWTFLKGPYPLDQQVFFHIQGTLRHAKLSVCIFHQLHLLFLLLR